MPLLAKLCSSSSISHKRRPIVMQWAPTWLLIAACAVSPSASTSEVVGTSSAQSIVREIDSETACWQATPTDNGEGRFVDATTDLGLVEPLLGMRAHAAAWGDVDGDGRPDLVVGTFAGADDATFAVRGALGPAPDRLLFANSRNFEVTEEFLDEPARTSGAAFADLDNDSDLDLVLSRYPRERAPGPSLLLENNDGHMVERRSSGLPAEIAGRSIGVLDYDRDGRLDLLMVSDPRGDADSKLLRNLGNLEFEDVTTSSFVEGVFGLGIGVADLNLDSLPDVFVGGSNRLFLGANGALQEVEGISGEFEWDKFGPEDDVAGVAIGDLNRDGFPDIVLGHHFNSTLDQGRSVPIRVYLHGGVDGSNGPVYTDVTDRTGLAGIPTKAPHVEIADMDNDGWPDLVTTASAGEDPAVFFHQGLEAGVPLFSSPDALGSAQYWVTGPTVDVDRDGRLDIFLAEWDPALPSRLLLNKGSAGNWLSLEFTSPGRGIGNKVSIFQPGSKFQPESLLRTTEVAATVGYTAGSAGITHFGIGNLNSVDVQIESPTGEVDQMPAMAANQHVSLPEGC